jgi:endonuclease YncB( thermonuclease family)
MNRTKRVFQAVLIWAFLLLGHAGIARAEILSGVVVMIGDGDTLVVLDQGNRQQKVRLAAIDAPELRQAFGKVARQHLGELVFRKAVQVEYSGKDRYGRLLGKVTLNGQDINLEQVRAGLAWHYKRYADQQTEADRARYAQAEDEARKEKRGLWKAPQPLPPWQFRALQRNPKGKLLTSGLLLRTCS